MEDIEEKETVKALFARTDLSELEVSNHGPCNFEGLPLIYHLLQFARPRWVRIKGTIFFPSVLGMDDIAPYPSNRFDYLKLLAVTHILHDFMARIACRGVRGREGGNLIMSGAKSPILD